MRGKVVEVTFLVRTRKWTATAALVVGSLAGLAVSTATAQATTYPVLVNPSANISPTPNFLASGECVGTNGRYTCPNPCVSAGVTWPTFDNGPSCGAYVLSAIDNARAQVMLVDSRSPHPAQSRAIALDTRENRGMPSVTVSPDGHWLASGG